MLLNYSLPWIKTGHLRPLHTQGVIFAFGGNALLTVPFYIVQRTCRTGLYGRFAPWFIFIGFNTILVLAAAGYIQGIAEGKEYA